MKQHRTGVFTSESLVRSMSPIDCVIDTFINERKEIWAIMKNKNFMTSSDLSTPKIKIDAEGSIKKDDETGISINDGDDLELYHCWKSIDSQMEFARIIQCVLVDDNISCNIKKIKEEIEEEDSLVKTGFQPSRRYIGKLVLRYVSRLENSCSVGGKVTKRIQVEDESLVELLMSFLNYNDNPRPEETCYVSFRIPINNRHVWNQEQENNKRVSSTSRLRPTYLKKIGNEKYQTHAQNSCCNNCNSLVGIRIFPYHNDVGLQKVWEAGSCLAEYLIENSNIVRGKNVFEIGSGVGMTGIILAGLCGLQHIYMTDHTTACLENIEYNIEVNKHWLLSQQQKCSKDYSFEDCTGEKKEDYQEHLCNIKTGHFDWNALALTMNIEFSTVGSANDSTFSKISSSITEGNSKMSSFTCYESLKALCFADILMAGDIFLCSQRYTKSCQDY